MQEGMLQSSSQASCLRSFSLSFPISFSISLLACAHKPTHVQRLARTIHIYTYIYGVYTVFLLTKHTVIRGVYIRFWQSLHATRYVCVSTKSDEYAQFWRGAKCDCFRWVQLFNVLLFVGKCNTYVQLFP